MNQTMFDKDGNPVNGNENVKSVFTFLTFWNDGYKHEILKPLG